MRLLLWRESIVSCFERSNIEVNDRYSAFTFIFWPVSNPFLFRLGGYFDTQRLSVTLMEISFSLDLLDDEGVEHVWSFRSLGSVPPKPIIPLDSQVTTV